MNEQVHLRLTSKPQIVETAVLPFSRCYSIKVPTLYRSLPALRFDEGSIFDSCHLILWIPRRHAGLSRRYKYRHFIGEISTLSTGYAVMGRAGSKRKNRFFHSFSFSILLSRFAHNQPKQQQQHCNKHYFPAILHTPRRDETETWNNAMIWLECFRRVVEVFWIFCRRLSVATVTDECFRLC